MVLWCFKTWSAPFVFSKTVIKPPIDDTTNTKYSTLLTFKEIFITLLVFFAQSPTSRCVNYPFKPPPVFHLHLNSLWINRACHEYTYRCSMQFTFQFLVFDEHRVVRQSLLHATKHTLTCLGTYYGMFKCVDTVWAWVCIGFYKKNYYSILFFFS